MDKIHEFRPIIKWKFGLDFWGHYNLDRVLVRSIDLCFGIGIVSGDQSFFNLFFCLRRSPKFYI